MSPEDRLAAHIFGDVFVGKLGDAPNLILASPDENAKGLLNPPGDELIASIRAVPGGKPGARQFEIMVLKAPRYVFGEDLSGWSEQKVILVPKRPRGLLAFCRFEHSQNHRYITPVYQGAVRKTFREKDGAARQD
ncbi:hypothetical protein [Bradyrhizobium sp. S3.2.12]|uniref:hypothetical protein n=1 Tax=Bradyrhizobium sp. S3.2.12 TaxID=3156387 RepID=UPI003393BC96